MPSDQSSALDKYTLSANGTTAGSYTTGGKWNLGGWATYPSADEVAVSPTSARRLEANTRR